MAQEEEDKLDENHIKNNLLNDRFAQTSPNIAKELKDETKDEKGQKFRK